MSDNNKWSEDYLFEIIKAAVPEEYDEFQDWYETQIEDAYNFGAAWANMCMLIGAPQVPLGTGTL